MIDGRLATIKGYIVNILSDDHYMEFIRNTYNKHSSFIGERYSNFGNTLSYILNISNDEYLKFIKAYPGGNDIINDIVDCTKYLEDIRQSKVFGEGDVTTALVNYYDSASVLERFIKEARQMNKERKVISANAGEDEPKRILKDVIRSKEEIERILKDAYSKDKVILNTLNEISNNKTRTDNILKEIKKQNEEVATLLTNVQDTKVFLDNITKLLQNREKEVIISLDNIEKEINTALTKRINSFKGDLNEKESTAEQVYADQVSKLKQVYETYTKQLNIGLKTEMNRVYSNIYAFKDKIFQELHDIENNIQREQLAYYFYRERRKLKGDIDINLMIYAMGIMMFICWYKGMVPFEFNLHNAFISTLIYLLIIVVLQIVFNVVKNLERIISIKSFKDLFSTTIINDEEPADNAGFDYDYNQNQGGIPETDSNSENEGIGNSKYKKSRKSSIIKDVFTQTQLLELFTPYWTWLFATLGGMLSIGFVAYNVFTELNKQEAVSYSSLLPYTAGYMLLIWFTWFCSKQFSYTKQICDEYEYKYALSKSYLSYRDEAKLLAEARNNEAILIALLDSIIKNIAQSPVQSVQRDCHTPFSEVFNAVKNVYTVENDEKKHK